MNKIVLFALLSLSLLSACNASLPPRAAVIPPGVIAMAAPSLQPTGLPTHCRANEYPYLNARMSDVIRKPAGGYDLRPSGKVVSICADRPAEPFSRLVYRFGAPGKPELEHAAETRSPFSIYTRSTTLRTGENIFSFTRNGYRYYVTEALGMGSGVSIRVFQAGRQKAELFSGNNSGVDFAAGLIDINFDQVRSPIFVKQAPTDKF